MKTSVRDRIVRLVQRARARFVRPEDLVLKTLPGTLAPGGRDRLAIFSHFDPADRIADYVVYYVAELARAGYEVVFVTTAEGMTEAELDRVRPHCSRLIVRRNLTLDFGSWKTGLASVPDLGRYTNLILCNDSCYGPISDFGRFLGELDPARADAWGMTDSRELDWHLQSYFLLFHAAALKHPAFARFWHEFRFVKSKRLVIRDYELGLSAALRSAGLRLQARYAYEDVAARALRQGEGFQYAAELARGPLNTTLFMWDILARDLGAPLVKTELFKQDRFGSRALADWRAIVGAAGRYDLALIPRAADPQA